MINLPNSYKVKFLPSLDGVSPSAAIQEALAGRDLDVGPWLFHLPPRPLYLCTQVEENEK